jgi:CheY-like chemotaxis protein
VTRCIILLIKKDNAIREVTQLCLEVTGHWHVLTASSGDECIVKAATERVDAILVNNDVDCTEEEKNIIFYKLRNSSVTTNIPVILLTNSEDYNDLSQANKQGIKAVITKPFDLLNLAYQVAAALEWEI